MVCFAVQATAVVNSHNRSVLVLSGEWGQKGGLDPDDVSEDSSSSSEEEGETG